MTAATNCARSARLYGSQWQTLMARALPVSTRTIRYWLSGKRNIRGVIARRIKSLRVEPPGSSSSRD